MFPVKSGGAVLRLVTISVVQHWYLVIKCLVKHFNAFFPDNSIPPGTVTAYKELNDPRKKEDLVIRALSLISCGLSNPTLQDTEARCIAVLCGAVRCGAVLVCNHTAQQPPLGSSPGPTIARPLSVASAIFLPLDRLLARQIDPGGLPTIPLPITPKRAPPADILAQSMPNVPPIRCTIRRCSRLPNFGQPSAEGFPPFCFERSLPEIDQTTPSRAAPAIFFLAHFVLTCSTQGSRVGGASDR